MDNLPMMSATQLANAPFNEPMSPEVDFDVNVMEVLTKKETVYTDLYTMEEDMYVTDDVDWQEAFLGSHSSASALIKEMAKELTVLVEHGDDCAWESRSHLRHLRYLIKEAEGWETDELNVEY